MTKNERLVNLIDSALRYIKADLWENEDKEIFEYWEKKIKLKLLETKPITKNGQAILEAMRNSEKEEMTAVEIADLTFSSGRSVSSSMRKLVDDGLVTKRLDTEEKYSVVRYSLIEKKENKLDNKNVNS